MYQEDTESIEIELKERVKELECLYMISSEIESEKSVKLVVQNSVIHLVNGFQFPEIATANITLDDLCFGDCTTRITGSICLLQENIFVNKEKRGAISIFYHRKEEFLPEERKFCANHYWS